MSAYRKILVPVDGSKASQRGLREAVRLAKEQDARIVLLHVVDEFYVVASPEMGAYSADMVELLRKSGKRLLEKARAVVAKQGVKVDTVMREIIGGPAAGEIVRQARKIRADLIVIGTHGRRGIRRVVMGSDAEQVVRTSPVPVLMVRS